MKTLILFVLFLQIGPGQPTGPITLPSGHVVCDGSETPCNPDKPWMRGMVEKFCGKTPEQIEALQKDHPDKEVKLCPCKHMCNSKDPFAVETGGVTWDAACDARCNPANCKCRPKCDS